MRNFVVVVLLLVAIGCGDGPSSPTAPAPAPTPQASLVQTGTPSLDCGIFGCTLDASIQNIGAGCASGTAVVARLTDSETNEQVGSDIQMRAATGPLSNLPSLTIRPQEIVALTSAGSLGSDVASRTVRVQLFPTWNNVSCP